MSNPSSGPHRSRWSRVLASAVTLTALSSCQLSGSGPAAPPAKLGADDAQGQPPAPPGTPAGAAVQQWLVDVDPLHAAAFERPPAAGGPAPGELALVANFPEVSHDPERGRTTVVIEMTNAGARWQTARLTAQGERPLLTDVAAAGPLPRQDGETDRLTLTFDNPAGDSFSFQLGVAADGGAEPSAAGASPPKGSSPAGAPEAPVAGWQGRALANGVSATASSSLGALSPNSGVDGNLASFWASADGADPTLTLDLGTPRALAGLALKIAPFSGGATYQIDVAKTPGGYQAVGGAWRSSGWNLETRALPSGTVARYVRLRFLNAAGSPERRFSVYEAQPLFAGGPGPTPAPSPTPSPEATSPIAKGTYANNFEGFAAGAAPSDFVDPRAEGYSYGWMPSVKWNVQTVNGSKQYVHDGLADKGYLSFRRYKGGALGTSNGQLPARYHGEVTVTPLKSNAYAPTGDQGTQFYYLDPTHYVELLIKPKLFEVWVADGAVPFTSKGWSRVYYSSKTTNANQARKLAAEIDCQAHTLKAMLDGQTMTTLSHPMLTTKAHYFALRGTGNVVAHDNLLLQPR